MSIQVHCFELLLHPVSSHKDYLTSVLYFYSDNSREDFPSFVFKVTQMPVPFSRGLFFGPTPFLINRGPGTHFHTPALGGLLQRWEGPHGKHRLTFCLLFSCPPSSLFSDLCVFVTNGMEMLYFPKGLILVFALTLFFSFPLSILNTYEQMELFLNTLAEFSLTDT